MDIRALLKLSEIKEQEINSLRNDFLNLSKIVIDLERNLAEHVSFINKFIDNYANDMNCNNNSMNMLNARVFLQDLNAKSKQLESTKLDAELQKSAAFDSLKDSVVELRKLTKVTLKARKLEMEIRARKEFLIDDTLEMHRYNRAS